MPRTPIKVCQKRDGKAQWIDKIFVCCICGQTVAGGPGIHTYDVWGKDIYYCKKCAFQKFYLDIDGGKVLNDYLKEDKK